MTIKTNATPPLKIVVLISGNGTNLQSILNAKNAGLNVQIQCVISNNLHAFGLQRATQAGIPTVILPHTEFPDREAYDYALTDCIMSYRPELIVLAGFMRILGPHLIAQYPQQIINIHPSLLPNHKGLDTHTKVLTAKETKHGCSVHLVNCGLDEGPIIAQAEITVGSNETVASLTQKVLQIEHLLYPEVLQWFAQSRVQFRENSVFLDNILLPKTGLKLYIHEPSLL